MTTLWIDVEDLFQYAAAASRPSGIQRLSFELQQALVQRFDTAGQVRFLRHDPVRACFAEISWDDIAALYRGMVALAPPKAPARKPPGPQPRGALRRGFAGTINRLPSPIREPLARAARQQKAMLAALVQAARLQAACLTSLAKALQATLRPHRTGPNARLSAAAAAFATAVRPGDFLVALGSPWWHRDYAATVVRARERHGMRFALLLYDLIPIRHPEWCDGELVVSFTTWFDGILPLSDVLLTISQATAQDAVRHAARHGIALPGPIMPIPIGTGFGAPKAATAQPSPGLPRPGSYVLFVSTLEARKNHMLLFRVWHRLLEEMPPGEVPTLVFAGRRGWLVADLLAQLDNTNWLDGRIVHVEDPSDADLTALYRGCLFTVFPSLYEGWGLPVTESLAFGKPCVVAAVASLPEAGGDLARYFDPDNLHDAVGVIRAVLQDRPGLAAWEERVRREFRPVPWSASAEAVLRALEVVSTPIVAET